MFSPPRQSWAVIISSGQVRPGAIKTRHALRKACLASDLRFHCSKEAHKVRSTEQLLLVPGCFSFRHTVPHAGKLRIDSSPGTEPCDRNRVPLPRMSQNKEGEGWEGVAPSSNCCLVGILYGAQREQLYKSEMPSHLTLIPDTSNILLQEVQS